MKNLHPILLFHDGLKHIHQMHDPMNMHCGMSTILLFTRVGTMMRNIIIETRLKMNEDNDWNESRFIGIGWPIILDTR